MADFVKSTKEDLLDLDIFSYLQNIFIYVFHHLYNIMATIEDDIAFIYAIMSLFEDLKTNVKEERNLLVLVHLILF